MTQRLRRIGAAAAERHRALQGILGVAMLAGGAGWLWGVGWSLIVGGAALVADVAVDALPRGTRRTA